MERNQLASTGSQPSEKVIVRVFQTERDVKITARRTGTSPQRVQSVLEDYGFDFSFMPEAELAHD